MRLLRHSCLRLLARLRRDERGQSVMEYALAISVIVIAAVAASWPFYPAMQSSVQTFGNQYNTYYATDSKPGN